MSIGKKPRGQDFKVKFEKGEWAENRLIESINQHPDLIPIQYGISRNDALYTEQGLDNVKEPRVDELKRPDILVFHTKTFAELPTELTSIFHQYNSLSPDARKPYLKTIDSLNLPNYAVMAIEAEASIFNTSKREFESSLSAYVKDEDLPRLTNWCNAYTVPLRVCQLFYDCGYIIPFKAYQQHESAAKSASCTAPYGITHDSIPNLPNKSGIQIAVDDFPPATKFGDFKTPPEVICDTKDGAKQCTYTWNKNGKLDASTPTSDSEPRFNGGKFNDEATKRLAAWCEDPDSK
ncbi:AccI family restriction endonuclease [Salinibaculum rarum]|uniref:AccI family restriction endonuclease n=1 Tax=Salinibaculum rarum TaxID=3058903 RepID=UPI00265E77EE|nr:AccI family restriction endonuclease [Salinibaculum sp. KK48]